MHIPQIPFGFKGKKIALYRFAVSQPTVCTSKGRSVVQVKGHFLVMKATRH